ncbi:MAG: TIGR01777 family oxidoreductase [Nocardioidaceae bacterium]|nr:TIGR01777 family oxidoreductase [Nocardioidaceae bacterium]
MTTASGPNSSDATAKSVVVAGSSGFLGTHLAAGLRERGHRVTPLVRREPSAGQSRWDPSNGVVDASVIGEADVVVNLAGAPLIGNPHSKKWARDLLQSRLATTSTLADAIAAVAEPPALVNGSGISWYGDHGAVELTETSDTRGHALLTRVCREWEAAARPAQDAGARVVLLRTAPVQNGANLPLKAQRLQFKAGLGGRMGGGDQHYPVISLRDWVGATIFLIEHSSAAGPVNLCSPTTPTNAEFTRALADLVHRPAIFAVPAPVLRLAAGAMAPEVLGSLNTRPALLLDLGYRFHHRDVRAVLTAGLA